jgi:hypothetical protein
MEVARDSTGAAIMGPHSYEMATTSQVERLEIEKAEATLVSPGAECSFVFTT